MLFRKPACDWLIVGLGNPGDNYARTRHNAGFRALDCLAGKLGVKLDRAKFRALTVQATWQGQKLLLMKPQTFMNNSGLAVMDAVNFYKLPPERVIVIFDGRPSACACGRLGGRSQRHQVHHRLSEQSELSACEDRRGAEAASGLRSCRLGALEFHEGRGRARHACGRGCGRGCADRADGGRSCRRCEI